MDSWMIGRLINLVSVGSGLSQSQIGGGGCVPDFFLAQTSNFPESPLVTSQ